MAPTRTTVGDARAGRLRPTAGNWGFINRNAIGAPTAFLRSGPADAPVGDGALNLTVRDGTEKVAYGNETDFVGDDFSAVDAVGFRVYTTGENTAKAPAGTPNMPGIIFEIDPNVDGKTTNYSSAVFMPGELAVQRLEPVHRRHHDRPLGPHRRRVRGHDVRHQRRRAARSRS